jgi:hypothetical protein
LNLFLPFQVKSNASKLNMFDSFFTVLQIKGSKALSHAQEGTICESTQKAENKLKSAIPALDWEHMTNRLKGELHLDLGITVHPQGRDGMPLTGFWRLDCLEASMGAAGYLKGRLHTINTFSLLGGLQAPAPLDRMQRTHLGFLSMYNLSWEVVRPKDNQRVLFQESHVYERDPWFHEEVKNVKKTLEDVQGLSYGVRWELRMGWQVLEPLSHVLDNKVRFNLTLGWRLSYNSDF